MKSVTLGVSIAMFFVTAISYHIDHEWQFSAFLSVYNFLLFLGWKS